MTDFRTAFEFLVERHAALQASAARWRAEAAEAVELRRALATEQEQRLAAEQRLVEANTSTSTFVCDLSAARADDARAAGELEGYCRALEAENATLRVLLGGAPKGGDES